MARYVLANDVNYLGNILVAGKIIDSSQYDIQALQAARALLYPYNGTIADRARELDALRYRGQALDFGTAQAMDIVGSFNDANYIIAASRNQTICAANIMVDALLAATSVNETIGDAELTAEVDLVAASLNETTAAVDITVEVNLVADSVNETTGTATLSVYTAASFAGLVGDFNGDLGYGGGSWVDQSSAGNNLALTGTATGAGLNGHTTVLFDGVADEAQDATFGIGAGTAMTLFVVTKVVAVAALDTIASYDGADHMLVENVAAGDNPQYVNGASTAVGSPIAGAFHILCARDTGVPITGEIQLFIDGVSTGVPAVPVNTFPATAVFAIASLGGSAFANVDVARCLFYNRDLTSNERSLVTEILQGVYGL